MSKDVSFSMNTGAGGGKDIIQDMAAPMIQRAAESICDRANKISQSMRMTPQTFEIDGAYIGLKNRYGGMRAYYEVKATKKNGGEAYYHDVQTLHAAVDAGRLGKKDWS